MGASGAGKSTLLNALTYRNLNGVQVRIYQHFNYSKDKSTSLVWLNFLGNLGTAVYNDIHLFYLILNSYIKHGIVGSVVECSPATRAARVRFPDDAVFFYRKRTHRDDWF
jgi:hypothetical protein